MVTYMLGLWYCMCTVASLYRRVNAWENFVFATSFCPFPLCDFSFHQTIGSSHICQTVHPWSLIHDLNFAKFGQEQAYGCGWKEFSIAFLNNIFRKWEMHWVNNRKTKIKMRLWLKKMILWQIGTNTWTRSSTGLLVSVLDTYKTLPCKDDLDILRCCLKNWTQIGGWHSLGPWHEWMFS